jgi:hypothetical protein
MNSAELTTHLRYINSCVSAWMEGGRRPFAVTPDLEYAIDSLVNEIHGRNVAAGWWSDLATGQRKARNVGEMLMLSVSELAEVPESHHVLRRQDDKLPHRLMFEVELADCNIRLFDTAGGTEVPLGTLCCKAMSKSFTAFGPWSPQWNDSMLLRPVRHLADAMEGRVKEYGEALTSAFLDVFAIGIAAAMDVPGAIAEKLEFNASRADHKVENRMAAGGKQY